MDRNRRTVADMRELKAAGTKISMLYVTTTEEAAAADAAGIHMLSIEGKFFTPEMRKAAGSCFVQVGLPYGGWGTFQGRHLATAEDYLRAAYHFTAMGGDCLYCAASYDIQKALCDNHVPIVAHVGLYRPTSHGPVSAPSARGGRSPSGLAPSQAARSDRLFRRRTRSRAGSDRCREFRSARQ